MKKLIILSVLAMGLALTSGQQASAWSNVKFGAGVNLHWQTGDNNLLWGVFRNGQIPHPTTQHGFGGHPGYGQPGFGQQGFGGYGAMPFHYEPTGTDANNGAGIGAVAPPGPAAGNQAAGVPGALPNHLNNVNYAPNPYGYYQPVSYYPNNYYSYQVPAYWYGQ